MTAWGSPIEVERRRRIRVATWAWAYERYDSPLASDARFDEQSYLIDPSIATGHEKLDVFFRTRFAACTGQWVYKHPELDRLDLLTRYLIAKHGKP